MASLGGASAAGTKAVAGASAPVVPGAAAGKETRELSKSALRNQKRKEKKLAAKEKEGEK